MSREGDVKTLSHSLHHLLLHEIHIKYNLKQSFKK